MKKNVKAIFAGLAAAALLAGFSSCSNGSSDDSLNKPAGSSTGANQTDTNNDEVFSGDEISFVANVASYDSKDSVLIIKYDRTAEGSDDAISLTNVKLNVTVNGETIETPSTINFELDPYSSFDKSYNYKSEETAAKQHDYKYKFNLGKKINVNDVVKVQLVSAKVTGAGASRVKLGSLTVSLIDVSQYATVKAYYTELCAENYKCLITKKNGADLNATVAVEEPANPTPANNTPENPAPANSTPENPTPANNTSTDTNNTTPAANTPTPVTVTNCKQYTVKLTKDITDASIIGFKLQTDNDGSQDANGLKIDISNLTMSVKVGNGEFADKTFKEFNLVPSEWDTPKFGKTNARKRLGLTGSLTLGTEITFSIKSATISNSAKKDAIIFALQEDGDGYAMLGTENGDGQDVWFPAFATN